jgi:hypothetical protein
MTSCVGDYCGTGSGNFPQPGDPDMNNSILQVVPAFGGIDVSWTYPELLPEAVAHTILYRSTSGTEATAVRYRIVQGDYFFDRLDQGIEYFYWIQFVSVNGTVGPMIGPESAVARPTIDQMIEMLSGQIHNGLLAESLRTQIGRIDLIDQAVMDESAERLQSMDTIGGAFNLLQTDVDDVRMKLTEETVRRVTDNDALVSVINTLQAKTDNNLALITQEQTARADGDSALSQLITALQATTSQNTAALTSEAQARADQDEALSIKIDTQTAAATQVFRQPTAPKSIEDSLSIGDIWIDSDNDNLTYEWDGLNWVEATAGIQAPWSTIKKEQVARATEDAALSQDISSLFTSVADNKALIQSEQTARAEGDTALATSIETLRTESAGNLAAAIQTEQTARTDADAALASQINTVAATAADNFSAIQTEQQARADADEALATNISTVQASTNTAQLTADAAKQDAATAAGLAASKGKVLIQSTAPVEADRLAQNLWIDTTGGTNTPKRWTGTAWVEVTDKAAKDAAAAAVAAQSTADTALQDAAAAYAAVQTEETARINADNALASQITTAQSSLEDDLASVQTTLQTNINTVNGKVTEIGALYTAKVDVNGLIGGFGVYNDGTTIQAGFDADLFWVGKGTTKRKPFIVDTLSGFTYIDNAAIKDASITSAKIQSLNADKISATALSAISANAGTLTAGVIRSADSNFKIDLNNKTMLLRKSSTGGRLEITDNVIRVYDTNGVLRVKIGKLSA